MFDKRNMTITRGGRGLAALGPVAASPPAGRTDWQLQCSVTTRKPLPAAARPPSLSKS